MGCSIKLTSRVLTDSSEETLTLKMKALCSPATSATIYQSTLPYHQRRPKSTTTFQWQPPSLLSILLIVFLCPLQEYFASWFLCSPELLCFRTHIYKIYTQLCSLQIWVSFWVCGKEKYQQAEKKLPIQLPHTVLSPLQHVADLTHQTFL